MKQDVFNEPTRLQLAETQLEIAKKLVLAERELEIKQEEVERARQKANMLTHLLLSF